MTTLDPMPTCTPDLAWPPTYHRLGWYLSSYYIYNLLRKDGEGIKEMELPPNADDETDIPLEPSVLIEHGQAHYNILISNI